MRTVFFGAGILLLALVSADISLADIYRWEDDTGGIHFTDNPANIPEKYRAGKKVIQKTPPSSGQPSVSTIGTPPPPKRQSGPPRESAPAEPAPPEKRDLSGEAEELRAKIAAKERYIEGIDRKRSHALNPLGNRFVSPEDLELYKKYSEELPKDRERLREISSSAP
jgi:hypothetical protein